MNREVNIESGKAVIFSAPSGAGKTTIVHHLLHRKHNLQFSISATTRERRSIERDGKDYHYLSIDQFKQKIANDEFVEWEEVYPDNFYGTLKSELNRIWSAGSHVIFDVDVEGGVNLKKYLGDRGGHCPPRSHPGGDGPPLSAPPPGSGAGGLPFAGGGGDAVVEPVVVLLHPSVGHAAGAAGEPGDGAFDHRAVLSIGGLEPFVGGTSAVLALE